jgi:hypothetical protein
VPIPDFKEIHTPDNDFQVVKRKKEKKPMRPKTLSTTLNQSNDKMDTTPAVPDTVPIVSIPLPSATKASIATPMAFSNMARGGTIYIAEPLSQDERVEDHERKHQVAAFNKGLDAELKDNAKQQAKLKERAIKLKEEYIRVPLNREEMLEREALNIRNREINQRKADNILRNLEDIEPPVAAKEFLQLQFHYYPSVEWKRCNRCGLWPHKDVSQCDYKKPTEGFLSGLEEDILVELKAQMWRQEGSIATKLEVEVETFQCRYEVCSSGNEHMPQVCPQLHSGCRVCHVRGHKEESFILFNGQTKNLCLRRATAGAQRFKMEELVHGL